MTTPAETLWKIYRFYRDGFREMTVGRTLWVIILIKLFLFFVIIRWLFFPDFLATNFHTDEERADHVRRELTKPKGATPPGHQAALRPEEGGRESENQ